MEEYFNPGGNAAQDYERFLNQRVIIFYTDPRGTHRKIIGNVTEIDGDRIWLRNINCRTGETWEGVINCRTGETWEGVINCRHNDISLVSTVEGWSEEYAQVEVAECETGNM